MAGVIGESLIPQTGEFGSDLNRLNSPTIDPDPIREIYYVGLVRPILLIPTIGCDGDPSTIKLPTNTFLSTQEIELANNITCNMAGKPSEELLEEFRKAGLYVPVSQPTGRWW